MATVEIICIKAVDLMHSFAEVICGSFHKARILLGKKNIAIENVVAFNFLLFEEVYEIESIFIIFEYFGSLSSIRTNVIC